MKIEESNVLQIPFLHFQQNDNYQHWSKIKQDLEYKYGYLTEDEKGQLRFARGYCQGFISGIHQVMSELNQKKLEVQILTLENFQSTLLKDIELKMSHLKKELSDIKRR